MSEGEQRDRGCFTAVPGFVLTPVTCPRGEQARFSWGEGYRSEIEIEVDMDKWNKGIDERLKGRLDLG